MSNLKLNIASYIDHTALKPTTTIGDIYKLCEEAAAFGFAAVCVPPLYIKIARQQLINTGVKIATVIGFPFGYAAIESKIAEIVLSIVDDVDELDVVVNITAIKNGDWQFIANEINTILPIIRSKEKIIKVIIESGVLTDDEIIKCCEIYSAAGVDFVKTSTGYAEKGASVEAVQLIRKHLGHHVKIKASGGIKTFAFAKQLIDAGADRIGCSSSVDIVNQSLV